MSFLRNSIYVTISNFFLLIAAYVLNVWVGRFLGPEDFGKYITVISIASLLQVIFNQGPTQAIAKVISEDKKKSNSITGLLLQCGTLILVLISVVYALIIAPLISLLLKDPSLLFNLQLLTPIIPVFGYLAIYSGYFIGNEKFGLQTIKQIIMAIAKIIFTIILTLTFFIPGAILSISLFGVAGVIFSLIFVKANPFRRIMEHKDQIVRIAKLSLPITAYIVLITYFTQIGIYMIKTNMGSDILTGYFGAAKSVLQIPTSLFSGIGVVLLAAVSGSYIKNKVMQTRVAIKEILRYVLILLIPSILFMAALPIPIIKLIYGSSYIDAAPLFVILAPGFGMFILIGLLVVVLNAIGKPSFTTPVALLMIIVHYIFGLLFLDIGAIGIAYSFVIGNITGLVLIYAYLYKKLGNVIDFFSTIKVLAVSLLLAYSLTQFNITNHLQLFIYLIIAGLIYVVLMFILKEFNQKDIQYIRQLLKKN